MENNLKAEVWPELSQMSKIEYCNNGEQLLAANYSCKALNLSCLQGSWLRFCSRPVRVRHNVLMRYWKSDIKRSGHSLLVEVL